jgi:O-antigen ligase
MPSIDLIVAILVNLAPYFLGAMALAAATGLLIPWSIDKPAKWLYFYILGISLVALGSGDGAEGSTFKQISWGICYALCLVTLYKTRGDSGLLKVKAPAELWILMAWMLASISWSPYELISVKRYVLILGSLLIAALTTRMTPLGVSSTQFLRTPLNFYMAIGLAFAVLLPDRSFDQDGALRAYATHKNPWGQLCVLYALVLMHSIITRKEKIYHAALMIPALVLLYLSKSATSILALLISTLTVGMLSLLLIYRRQGIVVLCLAVAGVSVATLVFTVLNGELPFDHVISTLFKVTEKSTTLTGRTHLWYLMWGEISHHLWLGTGIGGFWTGLEGASGTLARQLDWGPPGQAHNGYIDMLNETGIIGASLLLLLLLRHLGNCWTLYRRGHLDAFVFHSCIAVAFMTINYAESSFFAGSSLWFIVYISSVMRAHSLCATSEPSRRERKEERKEKRGGGQRTSGKHASSTTSVLNPGFGTR